jgi:hypothetical protein
VYQFFLRLRPDFKMMRDSLSILKEDGLSRKEAVAEAVSWWRVGNGV